MNNSLEQIKHEAAACKAAELEECVFEDSMIGLDYLIESGRVIECYIDVPVKSIVALGRGDFWDEGGTWRDALHGLHGRGWDDAIFRYFEGDLFEQSFPVPGNMTELRLACIGGACEVRNGNHRVVAGKAWLISRCGNHAIFRKAKTFYYPIHDRIKALLSRAYRNRLNVFIGTPFVDSFSKWYLYLSNDNVHELWGWSGDDFVLVKRFGWIKSRIFDWKEAQLILGHSWKPLPKKVLGHLLDDAWIENQLLYDRRVEHRKTDKRYGRTGHE